MGPKNGYFSTRDIDDYYYESEDPFGRGMRKVQDVEAQTIARLNRSLNGARDQDDPARRLLTLHASNSALIDLIRDGGPRAEEIHTLVGKYAIEIEKIKSDPALTEALTRLCVHESVYKDQRFDKDMPVTSQKRRDALDALVETLVGDSDECLAMHAANGLKRPQNGTSSLSWLAAEHWVNDKNAIVKIPSAALKLMMDAGARPVEVIEHDGPIPDEAVESVRVLYQDGKGDGAYLSLKDAFDAALALA